MKNKNNWIIYVLGFALLFVIATATYEQLNKGLESDSSAKESENEEQKEEKKRSAKDIIVYDIEGNKVKLYDFAGTPVVLNFWASWCGPCKREMPAFQKLYEEYGDKVQFMMVNLTDGRNEKVDTASAFIESSGYTFPVYYDTEWSATNAYEVEAIPATYLINAEGYIVESVIGALSEEKLLEGIKLLLGE